MVSAWWLTLFPPPGDAVVTSTPQWPEDIFTSKVHDETVWPHTDNHVSQYFRLEARYFLRLGG